MNQSRILSHTATPKVEIEMHNDGILHIRLKEGAELTQEDRHELKKILSAMGTSTEKVPMLLKLSPSSSILGLDAHSGDDCISSSPVSGVAIMTGSLTQRLAAIGYARAFRQVFPVEVFSDEEHAKAWLNTLQWHNNN